MKAINYLALLVFSTLAVSVLAEGELRQSIQLDTAITIAFRKRTEKIPASPPPQKPPLPGLFSIPTAETRYLYDVVVIEKAVETILETIEIRRFEGMQSGADASFALLAASSLASDEIVYVFSTKSKFYVNTAKRAVDGRFRKVSGELIAQGITWERAKLRNEGGVVRLYIEGNPKTPKVFERQESGSFVLKSP